MHTIVELPEFQRRAQALLSDSEKQRVVSYLAAHPQSGVLLQGTGGIRKLRWAVGNKGKSGGIRVIYYYHSDSIPLFLLTAFGKNQIANLSKAQRNELAKLTSMLLQHYGEQNG